MAYLCRSFIAANAITKSFNKFPQLQSRCVVMKVSAAKPAAAETHENRNLRLNRPLSPHLTIYKPQLTAMLSITHRMTGVVLSSYAIAFAAASVFPGNFHVLVDAIQGLHLPAALILSSKLCLAFPFTYHFCNGIRHLVWDMGKALSIKDVYKTGYVMIGASFTLALLLAAL